MHYRAPRSKRIYFYSLGPGFGRISRHHLRARWHSPGGEFVICQGYRLSNTRLPAITLSVVFATGVRLEIGEGFNAATLHRVLEMLGRVG